MLTQIATLFDFILTSFFCFSWIFVRFYMERTPLQKKLSGLLLFWMFFLLLVLFRREWYPELNIPNILSARMVFVGTVGLLYMLYEISPLRLSWREFSLLVLPVIIFFGFYFGKGYGMYRYYSWLEFWSRIAEPAAWMRLLILVLWYVIMACVYFLILRMIPIYQRHVESEYADINYNVLWLKKLLFFYLFSNLTYTLRMFWLHPLAVIFHDISFMVLFWILIDHIIAQKTIKGKDFFILQWNLRKGIQTFQAPVVADTVTEEDLDFAILKEQVWDWIEKERPYCQTDFSAQDLYVRFQGLHRKNLARVMIHLYGQNFMGAIQQLRIEEAMRRIEKDPSISLKSLSYDLGFSNPPSFTRSFKKVSGLSPSEYRGQQKREK